MCSHIIQTTPQPLGNLLANQNCAEPCPDLRCTTANWNHIHLSTPRIPPPSRWWSKTSWHFWNSNNSLAQQKNGLHVLPTISTWFTGPSSRNKHETHKQTKKRDIQHTMTINAPQWCIKAVDAYNMHCGKHWGPHTFSGCDRSRSPFSCANCIPFFQLCVQNHQMFWLDFFANRQLCTWPLSFRSCRVSSASANRCNTLMFTSVLQHNRCTNAQRRGSCCKKMTNTFEYCVIDLIFVVAVNQEIQKFLPGIC